jgi:hypothetical protein
MQGTLIYSLVIERLRNRSYWSHSQMPSNPDTPAEGIANL